VHAIGVCLGLIGVTIVVIAVNIERIEIAPILVYVIGLVTMLALSAAYNICPARQVGSAPARGCVSTALQLKREWSPWSEFGSDPGNPRELSEG
jgi:hypothetical protein